MVGTKKREGWSLEAGRQAQIARAAQAKQKPVRGRAEVPVAAVKNDIKVGVEESQLLARLETIVDGASERGAAGGAVDQGQPQSSGIRFELGRWTERVKSQLGVNHQLMLGLVKQAKSVPQIPLTISCIKRTRVGVGGGEVLAINVLRWRARAPTRKENSRDMSRSDLMRAIEALPEAVRPFYEHLEQQVQVLNFIDRHLVSALQEVRALVANNVPIEVVSAVLARHESGAPFCRLMGQQVRLG